MLTGSSPPPPPAPPPLPLHEDEAVVTRSPYQEAELSAVAVMRRIREMVTQVDRLSDTDGPARRLELSNHIRRCEAELRTTVQEARRLAVVERRTESYDKLQAQATATQQLIRAHYGALAGLSGNGANFVAFTQDEEDGETEPAAGAAGGAAPVLRYDIAQDREFQDYVAETQRNDAQIEAALDRIEFGMQRVNDNAQGTQHELDAQESTLRHTSKKAEKNEAHMTGMNKKLQRAIKKLGKSRLITYCVLCVILVVLIIVIIFLGKSL